MLTYKVSFSDTYYVGGGFASGVSYVSFDTKKDEIMTTRDIFPNTTDSLKLKETYLEAVMKFMESRMDSLEEYYPQEKRRQTVLDFLKDGYILLPWKSLKGLTPFAR